MMTLQEIIQEVTTLSAHERKQLIHILLESLSIVPDAQPSKRIPGLHAGTTWVSDDFDDPLFFQDEKQKGDSEAAPLIFGANE